ncbi:MAG: hypothetical protein KBC00_00170 [Candidatus Levybacteria bacterium]|nr:hypothetical protein [Candidatus Levybacteria bacterium]MBP9815208.1 hypothetical protein [Candidatus Levybacteria bacterium]
MTATGHAVIAALIAAKFTNPYIGLPLALVSHFAADMVPHWDAGTHHHSKTRAQLFQESVIDVLASIIAAYIIYTLVAPQGDYLYLYLTVFVSQLPDWIMAPYIILGIRGKYIGWSKWMYVIQHKMNARLDKPWGILTQIGTIILLYILLFRLF